MIYCVSQLIFAWLKRVAVGNDADYIINMEPFPSGKEYRNESNPHQFKLHQADVIMEHVSRYKVTALAPSYVIHSLLDRDANSFWEGHAERALCYE